MDNNHDDDLSRRINNFGVNIIKQCSKLPREMEFEIFSQLIIKSSSTMGTNYRTTLRIKSTADFINKLKTVQEKADEIIYFLELLRELVPEQRELLIPLQKEAGELLSIFASSIKTARKNALII